MIGPLHAEKQRLDSIFSMADGFQPEDELLAHWARYLCVLTSGLLENGLRMILGQYARTHASQEVADYVVHELGFTTNLNTEKIRQLIGSFSDDWRDRFDKMITDAHKAALDSITANRHNIAHGRTVGISMGTMKTYYDGACEVLQWLSATIAGV